MESTDNDIIIFFIIDSILVFIPYCNVVIIVCSIGLSLQKSLSYRSEYNNLES